MKLIGGIMESTLGKRQYANKRRQRNADAGKCLNETDERRHGQATSGVLCADCRATHRGHDYEREFGADVYGLIRRRAHRENRSIHEIAAVMRAR